MTEEEKDMTLGMASLDNLVDEVEIGWMVKVVDHFYTSESRDNCIAVSVLPHGWVIQPREPWGSQGMRFVTMTVTHDGDIEVDGRKLTKFRAATGRTRRSMPGQRQAVKTFTFEPPR